MGLNLVSDLVQVGKARYIASNDILAVTNNSLKDFSSRFLFCHKTKRVLEVHILSGGPGPLNSNSIISIMSTSPANFFFQTILSRKNLIGGDGLLFKNGTIASYAH